MFCRSQTSQGSFLFDCNTITQVSTSILLLQVEPELEKFPEAFPMKKTLSAEAMQEARTLFPGGVNSPVRAFQSVGGEPVAESTSGSSDRLRWKYLHRLHWFVGTNDSGT